MQAAGRAVIVPPGGAAVRPEGGTHEGLWPELYFGYVLLNFLFFYF